MGGTTRMVCWKCGQEVSEGQRFCANCGADLSQAAQQEQSQAEQQGQAQTAQDAEKTSRWDFLQGGNASMPLKIFAIAGAAFYGIRALAVLFAILQGLFRFLGGYRFMLKYCIANIPMMVLSVFICLVLLTAAFFRTSKNADGLFILLAAGVLVRMLYGIILQVILGYGWRSVGTQALLAVMQAVIVIGAWFLFSVLMGEIPLSGKDKDALVESLRDVMPTVQDAWAKIMQKANEAKNARAQSTQNNAAYNAQNNAAGNPYANVPVAAAGVNNGNRVLLKADRSLVVYILLGIVTCGIYNLWFIHSLAKDVNIACEGDGKKTSGLLVFILLSFITCGIYGFIWFYSLGNRLALNAVKYNMNFQENGITVLMWQLFGALLCGIGPFIALHIIIKNTNSLCAAYNNYQMNGLG